MPTDKPLVRLEGGRLDFLFAECEPSLRVHGHFLRPCKGPCVFLGARKWPVRDVY